MKMKTPHFIIAALVGVLVFTTTVARAAEPLPPKGDAVGSAPRLILQITVDQLRGDLLWHRLLGGQCLIMGDYVREMGATRGAGGAGGRSC